jgi:Tol biopolymer transport system component
MGEVYRARDTRLGRDVAIKVISGEFTRDRDRIKRFEQEARAAGALNHPNVCAIHDIGTHEGSPFVVMELLEGESLRARLKRGPIPARKAIEWAAQAAHGLAAAHEKGIVHRDLKPENLFLTGDGRVKVLDFGLAKLAGAGPGATANEDTLTIGATQTGIVMGTAGYMAPEQVRGEAADHRADLFALGAVVYELLTGKRAFTGTNFHETSHRILDEDPPPLSASGREIPACLEPIVRRCLEKKPQERFQSARDLAFDFESCLGSGLRAWQSGAVGAARCRPVRLWLVGAVLAIALLAAGAAYFRGLPPQPQPNYQKLTFGRGTVGSARFTQDGNSVIYGARWGEQQWQLFSTRVDAPGVTSFLESRATVVGIRGGEVAIVLIKSAQMPVGTLAIVPLGGGPPRPILENVIRADWNPEGTDFAVVRSTGSQKRLEYPPGKILFETSGSIGSVNISPDGRSVAFIHWPFLGGMGGFVMLADESGRVTTLADNLLTGRNAVAMARWSPDGSEVWFSGGDVWGWMSLRAVSLDGSVRTVLTSATSLDLLDIHRDGRVLLTSGTVTSEIWGCAPGDSVEQSYSWLDGSVVSDISADCTSLLFQECSAGGGPDLSQFVRRLDGSPPMRLGAGSGFSKLSRDGAWVLGWSWSDSACVLVPTGSGDKRILPGASIDQPQVGAFFPDGQRILFSGSYANGPPMIFVQDVAGGPPRRLTSEGVWLGGGPRCISPEGTRIAAISEAGPVIVPADGGEPQPIDGLLPGQVPVAWTQDGKSLFVVTSRSGGVHVVRFELATGRSVPWKVLRPRDLSGAAVTYQPLIERDGEVYFYSVYRGLNNLFLVEGLR